ncbi:hypothetical protein TSUD_395180 [Trifolium subterraneum]|uniref:Reverse transcriptase domain-containing protein n=1 Tax=Trifolium subterraneum TaxID=3900 RepID=A0A2Z6P4M8_TRISU|nr:hypothetical protein TSUD_395180 [Trifolium subterraneum]
MSCVTKSNRPKDTVSRGEVKQVGGVYNDGPMNVYLKLNKNPADIDSTLLSKGMQVKNTRHHDFDGGKILTNHVHRPGQCYDAVHSIPQILEIVTRYLWKFMSLIRRARFDNKLLSLGLKEMKKKSGDFNSISKVGERRGSSSGAWRQGKGPNSFTMSRLDRFLVSEGFIEKGNLSYQWVGDRDISNHCPIWLMCSNFNWGPKLFTFNNCWLEHPKFFEFVKETWENMDIRGKKAFIIKEKLKGLKEALKVWNREVFGFMELKIDKTVKELNEVEELLATGNIDANIINPKELVRQFWQQLNFKESLLHKKSRTKWAQEGDCLTGLMRKAVELGKFKGYRLNNNIQSQILQFADDTILMGEGIWDNIRIIKTLLRNFELVSGLKISFVKSKLYGLNVYSRLLEAGSAFLSCRSEVIPFKFLGIPVGANPRRQETWKPVVDAMIKRLNSWSSRKLSYGG